MSFVPDDSLLGGVLIRMGLLRLEDLERVIEIRRDNPNKAFGDVLREETFLSDLDYSRGLAQVMELQGMVGLRVLVVDDEASIRFALTALLEEAGIIVRCAASVEEARAAWSDGNEYEVCVLDKNLPDGTGLELAAEWSREHPQTEVVIVSGYASLNSAIEAFQCNVADYITKPFELPELMARLCRVFAIQATRRRADRLQAQHEELVRTVKKALESLPDQPETSAARVMLRGLVIDKPTPLP